MLAAAALLTASSLSGAYINGSIAFNGSLELDSPVPSSPTKFLSFSNVTVGSGTQTGDYVGTGGTAGVTMTPFTFDPFSSSIAPLWSFSVGPTSYSFDLASLGSVNFSSLASGLHSLSFSGEGTAYITGFDATPASFSLTTTGNASATELGFGAFTFAAAPSSVPDGGSTALLLGFGLLAAAVTARRRLSR